MNREERDRREEPLPGTAELPRSIEPARDLWPGIESRIRGEGAAAREGAEPRESGRGILHGRFDGWLRPLLAAATLALVFLGGWAVGHRGSGSGPDLASEAAPEAASDAVPATAAGSIGADPTGSAPMDTILAALAEHRDELDPGTVAVLERNLELIDGAMGEIRAALARDPGNARLREMLADEERRRGQVLLRAASLLKVI